MYGAAVVSQLFVVFTKLFENFKIFLEFVNNKEETKYWFTSLMHQKMKKTNVSIEKYRTTINIFNCIQPII